MQPEPTTHGFFSVHDHLVAQYKKIPESALIPLIEERKQKGLDTYGVPLQPFNGRDQLQDALEELMDALAYLDCCELETGDPFFGGCKAQIAEIAVLILEKRSG